ncbi:MAG: NAD(+)/NADH kinase [Pseudomonadota bacterium]
MRMITTAALFGQPQDPRVREQARQVAVWLTSAGVRTLISEPTDDVPAELVDRTTLVSESDVFIAIGGDGTLLYAARIAIGHNIPVLGINLGRLGFLTDISPDEMESSLASVLADEAIKETRMLLTAEVWRNDRKVSEALAVNDVVVGRRDTGRMIDFETRVDGVFLNDHAGDGLILATPTGSTAYALSCGGPILQPTLEAIALVPVCPHTLSDRPIVLPADVEIGVRRTERYQTAAEISVDGQLLGELQANDALLIRRANQQLHLLHPPGYDYAELLRSKLNWGADSRRRTPPQER